MSDTSYNIKALRLLDRIRRMEMEGGDLVTYTAFVLKSFYEDGWDDCALALKPAHLDVFAALSEVGYDEEAN